MVLDYDTCSSSHKMSFPVVSVIFLKDTRYHTYTFISIESRRRTIIYKHSDCYALKFILWPNKTERKENLTIFSNKYLDVESHTLYIKLPTT